jgi:hypothetical protein
MEQNENGTRDYYTLFSHLGEKVQIIDLIDKYDTSLSQNFHISTALAYLGRNSLYNKKHDSEHEDIEKALFFILRNCITRPKDEDFTIKLIDSIFNKFKPEIGFPIFFILDKYTNLFYGQDTSYILYKLVKAYSA